MIVPPVSGGAMAKLLWTVREHRELPADLWEQFKERAAADGHSPTMAMARLIRRYLSRGFDDASSRCTDSFSR
jgi:hypothetical protein